VDGGWQQQKNKNCKKRKKKYNKIKRNKI